MDVVLPIGTLLEIWLNRRLRENKNYSIKFLIRAVPPNYGYSGLITSRISWEDVEHPKVCTLIEGKNEVTSDPRGFVDDGGIIVNGIKQVFITSIYCASCDDFIDIEPNRPDVKYCPLCRQKV